MAIKLIEVDSAEHDEILNELHWICFDEGYKFVNGWWWIAYDGKIPVAFAGLMPSATWDDCAYLCRAGVIPQYRGLGLQRRLLNVREKKARKLNYNYLLTDTRDNIPSSNNLIKSGYLLYNPTYKWAFKDSLYWFKELKWTKNIH